MANTAPRIFDHLTDDSKDNFERVLAMLEELEVPHETQSSLVRGLDYYTGVVWEVQPKVEEGSSQVSLAGGGRYDGLVKELGGKNTAAVGGSIGIERVIDRIESEGIELTTTDGPHVFVAQLGEAAKLTALKVMRNLQESQINFAESIDREGMEPQLALASRLKVKWVIIVGQKEVLDKSVILRNMVSGMQEVVAQKDLADELNKRLSLPE